MQRKLAGYVLLSFLSFSVATTLFHTVANAQTIEPATANNITPSPTPLPPLLEITPTMAPVKFTMRSVTLPSPTQTPAEKENEKKTEAKEQKAEITPTPTIVITAVPTVLPTATPIPTAVPTTPPAAVAGPADLEGLFDKYSSEYGVNKDDMKSIAKCESGFNPTSNNSGMYLGMFQFSHGTWVANRNRMGLDANPELRYNAEESIRTAAFVISRGGRGAWPNC